MKHTSGPWVWDCGNHDKRERPFIRSSKLYPGADKGASVCKISMVLPLNEWEANARLIASAPELLEALRSCISILKTYPARDPNGEVCGDMVPSIAALAIAKAGGSQ